MFSWLKREEVTPEALAAEFFAAWRAKGDVPDFERDLIRDNGITDHKLQWERRLLIASAIDYALNPKMLTSYMEFDSNGNSRVSAGSQLDILMRVRESYRMYWERMSEMGDAYKSIYDGFVARVNLYAGAASTDKSRGLSFDLGTAFADQFPDAAPETRPQLLILGTTLFNSMVRLVIERIRKVRVHV